MKRKLFIPLITLLFIIVFAGCEYTGPVQNIPAEDIPEQNDEEDTKEDIEALFAELISRPELAPEEKPEEIISTQYAHLGLVQICYNSDSEAKLKLQVLNGDNKIVYNLRGDGSVESFSLQYGSGEYTVRIMENVEDDQYMAVETKKFEAQIDDEIDVYLNSIQNVNWDYDKLPIEDVPYIVYESLSTGESRLLYECSEDLYFFVTDNIDYDNDKINTLPYNYLPDIEETYTDKSGLCYDYASLFASMLRSIGVPAKLVKGYTSEQPNVYHAWTEVYIEGRWMILDPTMGSNEFGEFVLLDAEKSSNDYVKVYEY